MVLLENLQTQENREMDMANKLVVNIKKNFCQMNGRRLKKEEESFICFSPLFLFLSVCG